LYCLTCRADRTGTAKDVCKEAEHDLDYENLHPATNSNFTNDPTPEKEKQHIVKPKFRLNNNFYESVYVNEKPQFFKADYSIIDTPVITVIKNLKCEEETFEPVLKENIPYKPYSFKAAKGISRISKSNLLDSLWEIINDYIVAEDSDKLLILAYIFASYHLEWIYTLHYLAPIGDTGSGKSTILDLCNKLMYRPIYSEGLSFANVFRLLGNDEEGTACILEDEIQSLDKDKAKVSGYKMGYKKGNTQAKINMNSLDQKQNFFFTFAPKILAGERLTEDSGLQERTIPIYMIEGKPKYNISRLEKEQAEKIQQVRNDLLLWKLQNLLKPNINLDLELTGRNQELFEDFLVVMYGSKYYDSYKKVVLQNIKNREKSIHSKLEARIWRACRKLMENNMVTFSQIWNYIISDESEEFTGISETEQRYILHDGFEVSTRSLSKTITEKFRAKHKRTRKSVEYRFDSKVIEQLDEKYGKEILF